MTKDKYIQHLKGLAVYQVLGGLGGIFLSIRLVTQLWSIEPVYWVLVLLPFMFYVFSIYTGIMLWNRGKNSLRLTIINQGLQLVTLAGPVISYTFISGGALLVHLDTTDGISPSFGVMLSSYSLIIGGDQAARSVGVNIVALGIILFMRREMRLIEKEKILDEVDSIGSVQSDPADPE
ncbi:MAG: hypothetical protein EOO09_21520 [Chitinophagaceae bacterium]|nr:MAG: hypothetical protein EOO09_21520 [Chitinophagaceae bacterium]